MAGNGFFVERMFDRSVSGLNKQLDLAWKRNEAIVSNITNAETPQYRAVDVDFAHELDKAFGKEKAALMKTNGKHMDVASSSTRSHLVPDHSGVTKADGNNVDLDIQMGKLVYNSGKYTMAAQLVRKKLHMLRMAIRFGMR